MVIRLRVNEAIKSIAAVKQCRGRGTADKEPHTHTDKGILWARPIPSRTAQEWERSHLLTLAVFPMKQEGSAKDVKK